MTRPRKSTDSLLKPRYDARYSDQAITQIRDRGLVISGDAIDRGIGTMTRERWETFFTLMAQNGLYDLDMNWESAFTTKFINQTHSK